VLARLVRFVEDQLCEICPRLQRPADFATLEDRIFDFGMAASRDLAWAFAQELVSTPPADWPAAIAKRDAIVAAARRAMYPLQGMSQVAARWVQEYESADVTFNIHVVAE
jgi:hypothetical protein